MKMHARNPRRRRAWAGFTLVEVVLVVALASVIAALFAPGMAGLADQTRLRTAAAGAAAAIHAARNLALTTGRCVMVSRNPDGQRLDVARLDSLDCEGATTTATSSGPDLAGVNEVAVPALRYVLERKDNLTLEAPTGTDDVLVWRPTGWLRGDNHAESNVADDTWTMTLRSNSPNLNASTRSLNVVVTPVGLICVTQGAVTCP
ncbi:MAG: prepilin-type N-terminal cleavage/methylation domain-containing protein [Myxococcota bacterium]